MIIFSNKQRQIVEFVHVSLSMDKQQFNEIEQIKTKVIAYEPDKCISMVLYMLHLDY